MKTTIEISDAILDEAKTLAGREGTTLQALVEDGLRRVLASRHAPPSFRLRDASVEGRGLTKAFRRARWKQLRAALYASRD